MPVPEIVYRYHVCSGFEAEASMKPRDGGKGWTLCCAALRCGIPTTGWVDFVTDHTRAIFDRCGSTI